MPEVLEIDEDNIIVLEDDSHVIEIVQAGPVALLTPEILEIITEKEEILVRDDRPHVVEVSFGMPGRPGEDGEDGEDGVGVELKGIPFSFGDATPKFLGLYDNIIVSVRIVILVPFDGVNPQLEVYATGYPTLMEAGQNDPTTVSAYESSPGVELFSDTNIYLAITPGVGCSQGSGAVFIRVLEDEVPPSTPDGEGHTEGSIAGENINGHRCVEIRPDGLLYHADLTDDECDVIGISTGTALIGAACEYLVDGPLQDPSFSFIPGEPIYAGANGLLTQTPPATGMLVKVASAKSANRIFVDIEESVFQE